MPVLVCFWPSLIWGKLGRIPQTSGLSTGKIIQGLQFQIK